MSNVLEQIGAYGIVPVVVINNVEEAKPLAKALCEGGLPVAEVTFRTACAKEAISIMSKEFPEMLIGAGTVLTTEQVDEAVAAGAKFIVSPGLNPKVVKYCVERNIPITPGCANPSDIEQALELGLNVVKIFPAEAIGGIKLIKSMAGPYVNMKFMPTGGINAKNLNDYLSYEKIVACGGSWMVNPDMVAAGEFDKITEMTKEAITQMLGFELAHIGINATSSDAAEEIAAGFDGLFNTTVKAGKGSIFAGTGIEVLRQAGLGTKGHIAYKTNYINRAVAYLKAKGYSFDETSAKFDAKGKLKAIYLQEEVGGFAIHLLQK